MKKFLILIMLAFCGIQGKAVDFIDADEVFDAINSKTFDQPIVIEFWADWCLPSKKIAPRFETVAAQYQGKAYFFKIDVDDYPEVIEYFNMSCLPCILAIYSTINASGERQVFWTGAQGVPYLENKDIIRIVNEAIDAHIEPE